MNLHLACLKINIDVLGAECGYQITLAVALGNIFTQRRVQREKPGEPVILGRFNILEQGTACKYPLLRRAALKGRYLNTSIIHHFKM